MASEVLPGADPVEPQRDGPRPRVCCGRAARRPTSRRSTRRGRRRSRRCRREARWPTCSARPNSTRANGVSARRWSSGTSETGRSAGARDGEALHAAFPRELHPGHAPRPDAAAERPRRRTRQACSTASTSCRSRGRPTGGRSTARRSCCWRPRHSGRATSAAAARRVAAAREWPEHLGAGKPYPEDVDERVEDWMAAQCLERAGKSGEARALFERLAASSKARGAVGGLLSALSLAVLGRQRRRGAGAGRVGGAADGPAGRRLGPPRLRRPAGRLARRTRGRTRSTAPSPRGTG